MTIGWSPSAPWTPSLPWPYGDGYPETFSDLYGFSGGPDDTPTSDGDDYSDTYSDLYGPEDAPPSPAFTGGIAELPPAENWYVVNSVTGALIGTLPAPNSYELTEPVRDGASQGTIRIPLPADPDEIAELRAMLRPDPLRAYSRSIVWEIDGKILFGGPIPFYPYRDGAEIAVPVADWRSWFYHTQIRPTGPDWNHRYSPLWNGVDQSEIMTDLASSALATHLLGDPGARLPGAPPIVIDNPPNTGVSRNLTAKMFQGESIGHWLDDLAGRDKGADWGTYVTRSKDSLQFLPHFKVYWPEKRSTKTPFLIAYREGDGGNATAYNWPAGVSAPTRIFAVDGAEDTKLWGVAQLPGVKANRELLWEELFSIPDGSQKKVDTTTIAKGALKKASSREGEFTMTVNAEELAFTDYVVGDRFHVILEDNWDALDVAAARCTQRLLSGGAGQPTQQVLTLDISDAQYASDGTLPGYQVFM